MSQHAQPSPPLHQAVKELPVFEALDGPDWGLDFEGMTADVFSRPTQGLMRTPDVGVTNGGPFVYRNSDLRALAVHPDLGNQPPEVFAGPFHEDGRPGSPGFQTLMVNSLFTMHPPRHGSARQLVSKPLTIKSVGRFAAPVASLIGGLVDEAVERGELDFKADFANRVMHGFWSLALGMSLEESALICKTATRVQASNFFRPTAAQKADINHASLELLELLTTPLARELGSGEQELLVELAADFAAMDPANRPGVLEAVFGAGLLDGLHSLSGEITSVVHSLVSSEHHLEAVRTDRSLIPKAFHEGCRLHPAVSVTSRHALRAFTYDGVEVPEGAAVTMAWLFGNRDPEAFADPNRYELERANRRQTTFGGGFYVCPGRNVVKFLSEAVLTALTDASIEIVPTGDVRWVTESALHEPETMPIAMRRRV